MSSRSIPTDKLRGLLDAIQEDYPLWDGFSQSLADIFREQRIDPKAKYARFYSTKEPFLVISCSWGHTSLRRIADICDGTDGDGKDRDGDPLHLGKTTWINVLFTAQFDDATSETSALIVQLTERYGAAQEHLVVLAPSLLSCARCLAELALATSADGIRITVVGEWAAVAAGLAVAGDSFYARMEAGQAGDVALAQALAVRRFGSAAAFDAAVRDCVAGKLRAAALHNEACDRYCGSCARGIPRDEAAGRALFEEAAALGHAEAAYQVGECYQMGRGGLAEDYAEAGRWYRRAANGSSAMGQGRLALFYRYGLGGLPKVAAARLYSLAADQGDGAAMCYLGEMLEEGWGGVERDAGRAVELYQLALLKLEKSGLTFQDAMAGLQRLGAVAASDGEAARLARVDAARRGGRTPARLVAVAVAGGPDWDRLAQELAAAAESCDDSDVAAAAEMLAGPQDLHSDAGRADAGSDDGEGPACGTGGFRRGCAGGRGCVLS